MNNLFKKKQQNSINFKGEPTIVSNVHEGYFNPEEIYQVSIFYDGTSNLVTFKSRQRSLADKYFQDFARKNDGYVESKFANVLK